MRCGRPWRTVASPESLRLPSSIVTVRRSPWAAFQLQMGFAFSGMVMVLLGCILPRISVQFGMNDAQSGRLLLAQYVAAACGAFLVRRNYRRTLLAGYGLLAISAWGIAAGMTVSPILLFASLGLSLGMVMTATSMIIGRMYPEKRGAALAILNFFWSAGAVACPLLVAHFSRDADGGAAYLPVSLLAVFFLGMLLLQPSGTPVSTGDRQAGRGTCAASTIAYFSLLAFFYVGVESSVGNWISTYSHREMLASFRHSTMVVTCFWAAMLGGRLLTPAILKVTSEHRLYRIATAVVVAGVAGVLLARSLGPLCAAIAITGFALAPLYPLICSAFLAEANNSPNIGWVFAMAGFGGGVFPWMTGLLSTHSGSLHSGLFVPAAAAIVLALVSARIHAAGNQPSIQQAA